MRKEREASDPAYGAVVVSQRAALSGWESVRIFMVTTDYVSFHVRVVDERPVSFTRKDAV